jgi:succinylarginine dihydrolase
MQVIEYSRTKAKEKEKEKAREARIREVVAEELRSVTERIDALEHERNRPSVALRVASFLFPSLAHNYDGHATLPSPSEHRAPRQAHAHLQTHVNR